MHSMSLTGLLKTQVNKTTVETAKEKKITAVIKAEIKLVLREKSS